MLPPFRRADERAVDDLVDLLRQPALGVVAPAPRLEREPQRDGPHRGREVSAKTPYGNTSNPLATAPPVLHTFLTPEKRMHLLEL